MARSLAKAETRTHANSVSPTRPDLSAALEGIRAGASVARMATNRADIREITLDVLAERRVSQKEMAINANCPQSDLSNALQGKQRLDAQWLIDQDDAFVDRLMEMVRLRKGITHETARSVRMARLCELVRLCLEELVTA